MNERIKELCIKSGAWDHYEVNEGVDGDEVPMQEFAELIVRECLDIVNRHEYSYHEADPLWETAQLIKEHFRVE